MNKVLTRFFLIGMQRSGTTLLDFLLNEHPEIVSVCEWEITFMLFTGQYKRLWDLEFDSFVKVSNDHNVDKEEYLALVRAFFDRNIKQDEFIRCAYDLCLHSEDLKAVGGKEAMALPHYECRFMKKLRKTMNGDLKIVFLERDLKPIVNSFLKLGFFPPGRKEINRKNLKIFLKGYLKIINNVDKEVSRFRNYLYSTYEDLLSRPQDVLASLFTFLGVDASEGIISRILSNSKKTRRINFNGVKPQNINAWQENLSKEDVELIDNYYNRERKKYVRK